MDFQPHRRHDDMWLPITNVLTPTRTKLEEAMTWRGMEIFFCYAGPSLASCPLSYLQPFLYTIFHRCNLLSLLKTYSAHYTLLEKDGGAT
ncbi:unnamed protein product [Victoria cruziana]